MKKKIFTLLVSVFVGVFIFAAQIYAADVILQWDANTESNLAGYKLHYCTTNSGGPYTTTVDVGNILEYTFNDLDLAANNYWFVATAYSVGGFESGYSNEVTTKPPGAPSGVRVKVTVEVIVN